ncbi:MAG: response regulator [Oligoflexia bacterium]|nr:response regulator [Oligoflexia bacterium]
MDAIIETFFKVFLPAELFSADSKIELRKAKLLISTVILCSITALSVYTYKSFYQERIPLLELLTLLYSLSIPIVFKRTNSIEISGLLFPLGFLTLGFAHVLTTEGIFSPVTYFLSTIPFISFYFARKKDAIILSFIGLLEIITLIFLHLIFKKHMIENANEVLFIHIITHLFLFGLAVAIGITIKNNEEIYVKRLTISSERLLKANESKDAFWAKISHEIKTPLNGILGMTNLLISGNINKEQKDLLSIIKDSGENLNLILSDVIDYSKLESGEIQLIKKPFDIIEMLDTVISTFQSFADNKGIHLNYLLDGDVPVGILADEARLKQILFNLVNNAVKFTEHGYVKILVEKGSKMNRLRFSIEDSGIGIPTNKQDKIFKPFTQVDDSLSRKYGGSGLGLIICKNLVELMGGNISFESQVSRGTSFTFEIEFIPVQVKKVSSVSSNQINSNFLSKVQDSKLLVVEDNPINQKLLVTLLNKHGLKTDVANNGQEAVNLCHENQYDLIFMDIQMPIMDGIQATKEILRLENEIVPKIVAVTANTLQEDRDRCLEAGMSDFISKPISNQNLVSALERYSKDSDIILDQNLATEEEEENLNYLLKKSFKHISIQEFLENYSYDIVVIDTIVKQFKKSYSKTLTSIVESIESENSKDLEFHSHTLKGVLSSFYCTNIIKLVLELEDKAKRDELADTMNLYKEISIAIEELLEELEDILKVEEDELEGLII